ncbi:MAG: pyrroline-5-carboxylate reductase [Oscillospiraceae bacterium]|nr:pyrroline-5-carboxylate reductase [Oscillospiraceae bacterium]
MNTKFGFIGAGNMGGALARAAAKAMAPENITLADQMTEKAEALAAQLGCNTADTATVAKECGFIFLGVKPQVMGIMLQSVAPVLAARENDFVLVSMAAGVAISDIQEMAGGNYPVIRIMPNIPASVGGGTILFDYTENVSPEAVEVFRNALQHAGLVDPLPEKLIDAGSALSGCGPAFVSLFIEALADGAVACGLPRDKAVSYAIQTVAGTAKLLAETGMHPGALKDAVCSPGGTTIMGVNALEMGGFRGCTMDAVMSAYRRTLELGK